MKRSERREVRKKSEKSEMILYQFPGSLSSCPGAHLNREIKHNLNVMICSFDLK